MPMGLGIAVVFYRWSTRILPWSENGGNSTTLVKLKVCFVVILFSMDGLHTSSQSVEVIVTSAGNEPRGQQTCQ